MSWSHLVNEQHSKNPNLQVKVTIIAFPISHKMHTSICLALAASSLYLGNSLAAPMALPPDARTNLHSQANQLSPTPISDPKNGDSAPEQQKRQEPFGVLHDLILPQMISSPSTTPTPTPAPANGAIPDSGSITFDR